MSKRVTILGAGFGGLELSTMLSEALGDEVAVTLIDKSDSFVFGFSKLDVMFGRTTPETSAALLDAFERRGIEFIGGHRVASLDPAREVALLDDTPSGGTGGAELPYDLFLGVPKHRAPDVVIASGLTENGYVPVDSATLQTRFPGVYAVGDVATAGVPKAGVFAEGAARVVARNLIAEWAGGERPGPYDGRGSCYIEFGAGRVGRVDIDFLSGPSKTGVFNAPSTDLVAEKEIFGSSRRGRWFGT